MQIGRARAQAEGLRPEHDKGRSARLNHPVRSGRHGAGELYRAAEEQGKGQRARKTMAIPRAAPRGWKRRWW